MLRAAPLTHLSERLTFGVHSVVSKLSRGAIVAAAEAALSGCGAVSYASQGRAAQAIAHVQAEGRTAETYEAYLAAAYLEKAREEADEGQYQDAIRLADDARRFAELSEQNPAGQRGEHSTVPEAHR